MNIELAGARIIDPLHAANGQVASLYVSDDRITGKPPTNAAVQRIVLDGHLLMAGGIDIHTHIGGGKVNLARLLMAEVLSPEERTVWPTEQTGRAYAGLGYTACFEPAMLLSGARHTHLELADTPHLDSGGYVVLGNEDWLLRTMAEYPGDQHLLQTLVAWSVSASQAMAVKVVNPGGINAFKFNQRMLDMDEPHAHYGVTPRDIVRELTAAIDELGLPHPLHVHASNLGVPGNVESTLQTLAASEGRRLHLTHAQFNCYSQDGPFGMGSGAEKLARWVNSHPNITLDVGQIVFGQTVTISADTVAQLRNSEYARPRRSVVSDIDCQAGCGVVPMRYQDSHYVHSLQWTIGLELMLLIDDPWRVFLTTDHPNGGPFTCYPHLIRLLMDRSYRLSMLERIHPRAAERTLLREIEREYTLDEIAVITRAAPARILGMATHGSLRDGCAADVVAYRASGDWESTFSQADLVIKSGVIIRRDGQWTGASAQCHTHKASVEFDMERMERIVFPTIEDCMRLSAHGLEISDWELEDLIRRDSLSASRSTTPTEVERAH